MKKTKIKSAIHSGSNLLKAMEVFEAVAESGQMTAAARMLGLTQSAASQHIAALEKAYGGTLIDRSVRPSRLTQAGTLLHRHAARILNVVGDLEMDMRQQGPTPISVLRLGILASIATTLTPGLVALAKKGFGVRDVTLSAELRHAFAETALAREQGRAKLDRARADAAALRSLANVAQVLEAHPSLLQLRTLEAAAASGGRGQFIVRVGDAGPVVVE